MICVHKMTNAFCPVSILTGGIILIYEIILELLIWLTSIYEPRVTIPTSIESEHDRISLIKTVSQIFITKQHIKLNTKKLYQG